MVSIKPIFLYGVRGGVQGGVNFTGTLFLIFIGEHIIVNPLTS
jgi:hypothetical protein